ncbi:uncharacterized protein [Rutidosis leptorrhynchoides]|uniref:uncharacterized protein n=1 Tax=Rutidosis leptorrhynchoides TaxID=125765 RepID=UPI003A9934A9
MSFSIRDFKKNGNTESKINTFRKIRVSEQPNIVAIQESKCNEVSDDWLEFVWGSTDFEYIQKPKVGKSGGMLLVWDTNAFEVIQAVEGTFFLAIKGRWKGKERDTIVTNVYGPHKDEGKRELWESLETLMEYKDANWVLCEDFNEVRSPSERKNCEFIERRATRFNNFIENMQLIEAPLIGRKFTRISDDGLKLSKLDRFLVSESFLQSWGDVSMISLDRGTSDHCPIFLRDKQIDFEPIPFKIFDVWLENKEVEKVIIEAWNKKVYGSRRDCTFRNKLKNVKESLREWSRHQYGYLDIDLENAKNKACALEKKADDHECNLSDSEREEWKKAREVWFQKEKEKGEVLKQKSRLKWAVEGDENSKFFHSSIKRRNNRGNIRGLFIDGVWQENPNAIKEEIFGYYKKVFEQTQTIDVDVDSLQDLNFNKLTEAEAATLEVEFSEGEI